MTALFDAVGPSGGAGFSATGVSSGSWAHVCSASANRLLVVGVAIGASPDTGITVAATYNSVTMAVGPKVHSGNNTTGFVQLFTLVAPATGSNTVVVTLTGGTATISAGSVSFTAADQTTGIGTPATAYDASVGTAVSVGVPSTTSGNPVIDAMAQGSGLAVSSAGSGQTIRWQRATNGATAAGDGVSSTKTSTGGTTTMAYTLAAGDHWAIIGAEVLPVASGTNVTATEQPSDQGQATPKDTATAQGVGSVADTPSTAGQATPHDTPGTGVAVTDTAATQTQATPHETQTGAGLVARDTPSTQGAASPAETTFPLPPSLTLGEVPPTELDLALSAAPQVAPATLRFYGSLAEVFRDQDAANGYPLLRFLESGGRLLQNVEDLTKDSGTAPGWSILFDLTRAPTYALPWMGQTVGVIVDPTLPDAAQRAQILAESGEGRGSLSVLRQVALSFLTGPTPTVEIIERDGGPGIITVSVYASQLVGMSYAELSYLYPTYTALSAAYATYAVYAVGYTELYAALQQVKPAGLVLHLNVRTGPSYASLSSSYSTYTALSAQYSTYAAMIGSQPVTH